jgi:hypothetical protein
VHRTGTADSPIRVVVWGENRPSGEIHANIQSLAMVEAAVLSADTGERVVVADLLERRYTDALAAERLTDVRDQLATWGSAPAGIRTEAVRFAGFGE